jgi:hypothetical protein
VNPALEIMLRCADVAGRDVIVPANTFAGTGSRFYARIRLCRGGRGYGIARRSSCGRRNDGLRLGWFPRGGAR